MRAIAPLLFACVSGLWTGAGAAAPLAACETEPAMRGMRERLDTLHDQMNRIEWSTDRAQRRVLMDLHSKHVQESLREVRRRELGAPCRVEIMGSLLESMARMQQAMVEHEAR
jgi:hypothetical protein